MGETSDDKYSSYLHSSLLLSSVCFSICQTGRADTGLRRVGTEEAHEEEGSTSLFTHLYKEITEYAWLREVLLLGDFNTRTQSKQCDSYDFENPIYICMLDEEELGTYRSSADNGAITCYGGDLLDLGCRNCLVLYNGMIGWLHPGFFLKKKLVFHMKGGAIL